ncbi:hypothetical protein [Streptomyces heilongjiangensis]|uniref:Cytochrome P450 n=1 Tax=Streptomyces heilongjiangensis TaxID=945052 RepID=A0ABW1BIE3_9ACTN|nr:hypothetical protein [Streptomyces heilongjiangensis]MDC2951773.1 hypothetical protein [Streptomyces heilongjiangensis]
MLSDPRFSRAATVGADIPRPTAPLLHDTSILSLDPPEHTRLRRLVAQAFTVRGIGTMRPRVEKAVAGLLDAMEEQGVLRLEQQDLVREVTLAADDPCGAVVRSFAAAVLDGVPPRDGPGDLLGMSGLLDRVRACARVIR